MKNGREKKKETKQGGKNTRVAFAFKTNQRNAKFDRGNGGGIFSATNATLGQECALQIRTKSTPSSDIYTSQSKGNRNS